MLSLKVPPLGESIVEATVSRWLKQEGDAVATGETVVELDTDKITVEVPALQAGVLVKRAVADGAIVKVGDLLGEIDETAVGAPAPGRAVAAAPETGGSAGASLPPSTVSAAPVQRPAAAPSTPPVSSAPAPGHSNGKSAPSARRLADERGLDISTVPGTGRGGTVSKPDVMAAGGAGAGGAQGASAAQTVAGAAGGLSERQLAPEAPPAPAPPVRPDVPAGPRETRERMTTRRKRISDNLLQSHLATAHLTTFNEIDMTEVMSLRDRVKEKTEKQHGVKLSFMPFFVKATCLALKDFPVVNAQIEGDEIVYKNYVNMGIAVASDQGLIVPNVKDADRKGLLEVSRDITDLAKRARDGKLSMDDLTGGTFTITNGGVFGSLVSTPIINYPQVGILGLHKIQERPVAVDGKVEIRPMMYLALTYDHRIIDGQQAVFFLVRVKELMEDPGTMLIS